MKKIIYTTLIVALVCFGQTPAARAENLTETVNKILISEIQTGGTSDATEEFVELYNPNEQAVNITGWMIQYRPASNTASQKWTNSSTKTIFACTPAAQEAQQDCQVIIQPKGRVVAVNKIANIAGSYAMTGGFSAAGGQIRLIDASQSTPEVQDFVGYGTAVDAETSAALAPSAGKSLKRVTAQDGQPIDTNNNLNDFLIDCGQPTPGQEDTQFAPLTTGCTDLTQSNEPKQPSNEQPENNTNQDPDNQPTDPQQEPITAPNEQQKTYLPLTITEILPNPAAPLIDSADEFIEIYNPNTVTVTLKDYHIQAGSNYRYDYTLGDTPLAPGAYFAILSAVSNVSLANSGSGVRLIDPNGNIAYEVPNYGDAKEGQSWMLDEAGWHWSLTPTPGRANTLTTPQPKIVSTNTTTSKKEGKATTSSASSKTSAKTSTVKAPASTKKTASAAENKDSQEQVQKKPFDLQYLFLLPIIALGLGYVFYEYRQEIKKGFIFLQQKIRKNKPNSLGAED